MEQRVAFPALLWFVVAIFTPQVHASGFGEEEPQPTPLSSMAQTIQAFNRQFNSPARRLAPEAKLSPDERKQLTERLQLFEQLIRTRLP
jgi:hypothetical protein